jgi:capsular exopolysaccharide synthesis family protein
MEWIDGIRTMVLHDSQVDGTKVILIASADSREGKSTVAGHLAASLARAGRRTILIDGDLRRPFLHEMFGVPMQPGLSEVILGEVDLAEGINETPEENLVVMPSGQWDRQVIQALARDGLSQLLLRLRQSYDYVIIDSHPILDATDALLMSKQADAVILTAIKQNTQLPRLYTASQRLAALHVNVLGVVVNGVDPYEVLASASVPAMAGVAA